MITLYDTVCTPCKRKALWRELKHFATLNKIPLRRVDVTKQPQKLEEAVAFEIELPVVVLNKSAVKLGEDLGTLLK